MKLILYGIGQGLDLVESKIVGSEIVGYTDSYSEISSYRGKTFFSLKEICKLLFDYIIITINDEQAAWEVYNLLIEKYNLPKYKILPFYVYANREFYKSKIKNCNLTEIQGLIFGNSHAECGFLEEELELPFLNLAISSQDIYYNYKIFENCINQYGEQLYGLRYIIIDLYDYCYFNFDTSLSSSAIYYMSIGGYLDEHNFDRNSNFNKSFKNALFDIAYMPEKSCDMACLFEDVYINRNDVHASERWSHIKKKNALSRDIIIGNIVTKRFENTIKENVKLLNLFLKSIENFNKNIKIIFTLIPRYIEMEQAAELIIESWKTEFEKIIDDLCNKYNALFWNYKYKKEISKNYMFYYDVEHLNTTGGRSLSAILNEDLRKLQECKEMNI